MQRGGCGGQQKKACLEETLSDAVVQCRTPGITGNRKNYVLTSCLTTCRVHAMSSRRHVDKFSLFTPPESHAYIQEAPKTETLQQFLSARPQLSHFPTLETISAPQPTHFSPRHSRYINSSVFPLTLKTRQNTRKKRQRQDSPLRSGGSTWGPPGCAPPRSPGSGRSPAHPCLPTWRDVNLNTFSHSCLRAQLSVLCASPWLFLPLFVSSASPGDKTCHPQAPRTPVTPLRSAQRGGKRRTATAAAATFTNTWLSSRRGEEREVKQRSLPTGMSVAGRSVNAPAVDSS